MSDWHLHYDEKPPQGILMLDKATIPAHQHTGYIVAHILGTTQDSTVSIADDRLGLFTVFNVVENRGGERLTSALLVLAQEAKFHPGETIRVNVAETVKHWRRTTEFTLTVEKAGT